MNSLKSFKADLHIHTVLSPCSSLLMTPGRIIEKAQEKGLDLIAITDHNSSGNLEVALRLAARTPLTIIPGIEVESVEEVHLLCLFDKLEKLLQWQKIVDGHLAGLENEPDTFGYQILTDKNDDYQALETKLLATATKLRVEEIVTMVKKLGGLVIPAHIDRLYNSLLACLGFIPSEPFFPLLEIASGSYPEKLKARFPSLQDSTLIKNSDSHSLEEIKPCLNFRLNEISIREIALAAREEGGRKISLLSEGF